MGEVVVEDHSQSFNGITEGVVAVDVIQFVESEANKQGVCEGL